jgi:hypothetical protein
MYRFPVRASIAMVTLASLASLGRSQGGGGATRPQ